MTNTFRFALVHVRNPTRTYAMNKDLNGGFGTADDYGTRWTSRLLQFIKGKSVKLPIIDFAYLQSLIESKGHEVTIFENELPKESFDIIILYGTIVDYRNENKTAQLLKTQFPEARIGFCGPWANLKPELFNGGDFVLQGEAGAFFQNDFRDIDQLKGLVPVTAMTDLELLPTPDLTGFPINDYGYSPINTYKPFITLQASKGCPYSCRFYCTYGEYQGPKIRQRSAGKVVQDIVTLQQKHGIRAIQFRDPVFGLQRGFIEEFCDEMKKRNVQLKWGMETRLDLLNEESLNQMFAVGLRNINVGIETSDKEIAKTNKRLLVQENHQEKIIAYCEKLGIKISAFYILGYDGDTRETIQNTISYAKKLNTPVARFAISTPYPGTGFYNQLKDEGRILTDDYERYTQFNLVYKHPHFSPEEMKEMLEEAYAQYYFRPSFIFSFFKWKIRDFWL